MNTVGSPGGHRGPKQALSSLMPWAGLAQQQRVAVSCLYIADFKLCTENIILTECFSLPTPSTPISTVV